MRNTTMIYIILVILGITNIIQAIEINKVEDYISLAHEREGRTLEVVHDILRYVKERHKEDSND